MQTVSWAGSTYNIPNQRGDTPWSGLSDFAIAVAAKGLNTGGGNFTLLADVNFGANFGIVSTYFKSRTANIATAGILRLASTDTIQWRNNANGGNVSLSKNTSDELLWNGSRVVLAGGGRIVNADISASAAIAFSKMAALTASRALVSDGSGIIVAATTTSTEIGYVNGVTSAIQTQLDSKPTASAGANNRLAYYTGTAAIAAVTAITASRALASDSNGLPVAATTTATELGYVNGVTSAIQTQMDLKAPKASPTFSGTITSGGNIAFSTPGTNGIVGVAGTTAAAAGLVGENISASVGNTNATTSGNYSDLTSISLTAGAWAISCMANFNPNSAVVTLVEVGISITSGNSATGLVQGVNYVIPDSVTGRCSGTVASYVLRLSGTTTVYLKISATYSAATPIFTGGISAIRIY